MPNFWIKKFKWADWIRTNQSFKKKFMIFFQGHYASISANILHDLCFFSFPRENDDTDCFIKLSFAWEWWHWLHKSNDNFCSFSLNKPTNELPLPIKLLTTAFVKEKWGPKKWFLLPIKLLTSTFVKEIICNLQEIISNKKSVIFWQNWKLLRALELKSLKKQTLFIL